MDAPEPQLTAAPRDSNLAPVDVEAALAAVRSHDGPTIVDLDETLYLRNSTEDFIDTAVPAPLALLALTVLAILKPWRFTGGEKTRDVWRVGLILVFFPWTLARWRRRVEREAAGLVNQPLAEALRARAHPFTIATLGFVPVVRPLIAAMGFSESELIACRAFSPADRKRGKLAMVGDAWEAGAVSRSLLLTDSMDDEPLLAACATPLLVTWPAARWVPALRNVYLPGAYLTFVKRPGTSPLRALLIEDFPIWLLATLPLAVMGWLGLPGLFLLFLSFWSIYELGYIENDQVAARYESDGKVSDAFRDFEPSSIGARPWIYALLAGAAGVACLHHESWPRFALFGSAWLAVLVATRLLYWFYNRVDKNTRTWLYPGLQVARAAAFAVVAPLNSPGLLACAACVVVRSQHYMVYRHLRAQKIQQWPDLRERLLRLCYYLAFLVLALGAHIGWERWPQPIWWAVAALFAGWFGLMARRDLSSTWKSARRLDKA